MKIIGPLQKFSESTSTIHVSPDLLLAISARPGAQVYTVGFSHIEESDVEVPALTVLATPFPSSSWANLVRVSVAVPPRPGFIKDFHYSLGAKDIKCRYIESADGFDVGKLSLVDPKNKGYAKVESRALLSTIFAILETGNTDAKLQFELNKLRSARLGKIDDKVTSYEAERRLEELINEGREGFPFKVEWLSPMMALNAMSGPWRSSTGKSPTGEQTRIEALRVKLDLVSGGGVIGGAAMSVHHWLTPIREQLRSGARYVVTSHADTDDRYISFQFHDVSQSAVVEMKTQYRRGEGAHGRRGRFLAYLGEAKANVISSYSSARLAKSLEVYVTTCLFRAAGHEDVERMLGCFQSLAEVGNDLGTVCVDALAHSGPARVGHVVAYADNPYNYTLPMDPQRYSRTFGEGVDVGKGRKSLVDDIVPHLVGRRRENIAIVGAHRLGKTSILNLVQHEIDTLAKGSEGGEICISVRINASITPPHHIARSVREGVRQAKARLSGDGKLHEFLKKIHDAFSDVMDEGVKSFTVKGGGYGLGVTLSEDSGAVFVNSGSTHNVASASVDFKEASRGLAKLREELESLQESLEGQPWVPRFVVLVDEIADGLEWGGGAGLAVWRHMLESSAFASLRWLVATTRPIRSNLPYSPVGNVFREYNLGPLALKEAMVLLDAMGEDGEGESLRPFVTPHARDLILRTTGRLPYLMQVVCVHAYEKATSGMVPIVTRSLVMKVIRKKVIVELSDYFESEWRQLGDIQAEVKAVLIRKFESGEPLETTDPGIDHELELDIDPVLSPVARRALERSGVRGAYASDVVALLFSQWLFSSAGVGE